MMMSASKIKKLKHVIPSRKLTSGFPKFMTSHESTVEMQHSREAWNLLNWATWTHHGAAFMCNRLKTAELSDTTWRRLHVWKQSGLLLATVACDHHYKNSALLEHVVQKQKYGWLHTNISLRTFSSPFHEQQLKQKCSIINCKPWETAGSRFQIIMLMFEPVVNLPASLLDDLNGWRSRTFWFVQVRTGVVRHSPRPWNPTRPSML